MTAYDLIKSARYDLRDTAKQEFSDEELLEYLARALLQLEESLSSIGSDLVSANTSTTLSSGDNSVDVPENTIVVTDIWEGQSQLVPLTPIRRLLQERRYNSASGRPYYWAQKGNEIWFNRDADQDYTLYVTYDKFSGADVRTPGTTVPYNGEYDNTLREAVILQAKHRNEFGVGEDGALMQFFANAVMAKSIYKRYTPIDRRKLDF